MIEEGDRDAMIIEVYGRTESVTAWVYFWPEDLCRPWDGTIDDLLRALGYDEDTKVEFEERPLCYGFNRNFLVEPDLEDLGVTATVRWDSERACGHAIADLRYEEEAAA